MAVVKHDVHISRAVDKMATKFQRCTLAIEARQFNADAVNTLRYNRKSKLEDGGLEAGGNLTSCCR